MKKETKIKVLNFVKKLLKCEEEVKSPLLGSDCNNFQIQKDSYKVINLNFHLDMNRGEFIHASEYNNKQFDDYLKNRIGQHLILDLIKGGHLNYTSTESILGDRVIIESNLKIIVNEEY